MDNSPVLGIAGSKGQGDDTKDIRPTHDQIYIGERHGIGIRAIQSLNARYGVEPVITAMRLMHGFGDQVRNPVAYLIALVKRGNDG